jgi:hypothetical protein
MRKAGNMTRIELDDGVRGYLVGGHAVMIATIEPDGSPYTSVVGSCVVLPDGRLRFAAWGAGRTLEDIRRSGRASAVTLGDDLVWSITGTAAVIKDPMQSSAFPPHPYSMVEITPETAENLLGDRKAQRLIHQYSGKRVEERTQYRDALLEELKTYDPGPP